MLFRSLSFASMIELLNNEASEAPLTELFYTTHSFWFIIVVTSPVITMRTFAQEKSLGTFETLMTAPVGEWSVVLAKFTGSLIFYALMWAPLAGCIWIIRHYSRDSSPWDPGALACLFAGILMLGAMFTSFGVLASSLTRNQSAAA